MRFNQEQAKGLANFFFDVAKGTILGGFGLSVTIPPELRLQIIVVVTIISYACIRLALLFLKEIK